MIREGRDVPEMLMLRFIERRMSHDINCEDGEVYVYDDDVYKHWSEVYPDLAEHVTEWDTRPVGEVRYTSAPRDYDGFGTYTLGKTPYHDGRGRPIRKVSIEKEHLWW